MCKELSEGTRRTREDLQKAVNWLTAGNRMVIGTNGSYEDGAVVCHDGERCLIAKRRASRAEFLANSPRPVDQVSAPFYYELELRPEPRRSQILDPATGRVFDVYDFRNSQTRPKRPATLACDFCNRSVDRLYCRPTRPFCAFVQGALLRASDFDGGTWNACDHCRPLVDARDAPGLVRAAARRLRMDAGLCEFLRVLYETAFAARIEDQPELVWRSGDEFPPRPTEARP